MAFVRLFIYVTFLASSWVLSISEYTGGECNGTVTGTLVYEDGEVVRVESDGRDVSSAVIAQFNFPSLAATLTDQERYAGENGIIVEDDGHNILFFPGGAFGQNVVHLFNYTSKSTSAINVYCQPVSLAYRPDDQRGNAIVGHCKLNTTIMRVPYFVLGVRSGKWTDISSTGLYSDHLDTTNLTNTVILQYESEYDQLATKSYFAGGNTLHEINLGNPGVDTYPLPDECQIRHLVPVGNSSFPVLRVTCYNGNSSGYSHHYFASSQSSFMSLIFHTDFVAYDSFNLDYLVTFANYKTLSIIRRDKTSQQFPLNITLDDPIQCENMVMGPNVHYLICLADDGLYPVIINITEPVTSKVIPVFNTQIVRIRLLTNNTFYLLTAERELLIYVVNPIVVCLGRYALRRDIDYVVTSATSDIICSNAVDIRNTRNSPYLPIIIIISFVAFFALLLLVLLMLRLLKAVCRASRADNRNEELTNSTHVDDKEEIKERASKTAQDGGNETTTTYDDHDRDEMDHGDDDDVSTNVLESAHSSGHTISTGSFIIERDPSAENANDERNNPGQAASGRACENEPNPNVKPFESSAKSNNFEKFELRSSQPEPFVEAEHVIMPVSTTRENELSPAPAVERMDL